MISVRISNTIPKATKDAEQLITRNAIRHVNRVANYFRNEVMRDMRNTPKTGNTYTKKGGKKHVASSEGNPPAIDTGRLVSSITMRPATAFSKTPTAKVSTNVEYSQYLELVYNRPFMSKESKAFNKTRVFANKIAKTIMVK
tara:strand:+ start:482 stop:907 length:426 start_codon:yes stop_codon:yes gene_type:complete